MCIFCSQHSATRVVAQRISLTEIPNSQTSISKLCNLKHQEKTQNTLTELIWPCNLLAELKLHGTAVEKCILDIRKSKLCDTWPNLKNVTRDVAWQ